MPNNRRSNPAVLERQAQLSLADKTGIFSTNAEKLLKLGKPQPS